MASEKMSMPIKWGNEFQLDYSMTQFSPFGKILSAPDGGFLYLGVASTNSNSYIFSIEHYDSSGCIIAEDAQAYEVAGRFGNELDASFLRDGNLSLAWSFASLYGSISLAVLEEGEADFSKLENVPNHNSYVHDPKIIRQLDGGFVLLWHYDADYSAGVQSQAIRAQYFDGVGNREGDEFIVHLGGSLQSFSGVQLGNNSNVIVWAYRNEQNSYILRAQISDESGARKEFDVNEIEPTETCGSVKVIALSGDRFVVFWSTFSTIDGDIAIRSHGQMFLSSGEKLGDALALPSASIDNVAELATGEFLVTWFHHPYGSPSEVRGQVFSSDGATVGDEFLIHQARGYSEEATSIATLSDGRFVVSWGEVGPGIDGTGATIAQIFDPRLEAVELVGSSGNDTQAGTQFDDWLLGLGGDDVLLGGGGDDLLTGGSANDLLDGGTGGDWMRGGTGNDQYVVDDMADRVFELSNQGADTVFAAVTHVLSKHVEDLTLTEADAIDGFGNALANTIIGNEAANRLEGRESRDTLTGAGGDDTLDGGDGVDSMNGGEGNDSYVLDRVADIVTEAANAGIDTVLAAISYTLGGNVEQLELTGTAALNGTGNELHNMLLGNAGKNRLSGLEGDDTLIGRSGADRLDGGSGADQLEGGTGSDSYVVDNLGDVVFEDSRAGKDRVESLVSFTLGEDVENLRLIGTGNLNGTGNSAKNLMTGNAGNNLLSGGDGADTLDGGGGTDGLSGGTGADVFVFRAGYGFDRVTDFADDIDTLRLDKNLWGGGLTIEQVLSFHSAVVGGNVVLTFGADVLTIIGLNNVAALLDDLSIV